SSPESGGRARIAMDRRQAVAGTTENGMLPPRSSRRSLWSGDGQVRPDRDRPLGLMVRRAGPGVHRAAAHYIDDRDWPSASVQGRNVYAAVGIHSDCRVLEQPGNAIHLFLSTLRL